MNMKIKGPAIKFGNNIDTDVILPGKYLILVDPHELAKHALESLDPAFPEKAKKGVILVGGKNFGCGSSRQQAVDCFVSLGIQAIIAESFGAIYERNAINAAFPILNCNRISEFSLQDGDTIRINLVSGDIENRRTGKHLMSEPFSDVQFEIFQKGGLLGK